MSEPYIARRKTFRYVMEGKNYVVIFEFDIYLPFSVLMISLECSFGSVSLLCSPLALIRLSESMVDKMAR